MSLSIIHIVEGIHNSVRTCTVTYGYGSCGYLPRRQSSLNGDLKIKKLNFTIPKCVSFSSSDIPRCVWFGSVSSNIVLVVSLLLRFQRRPHPYLSLYENRRRNRVTVDLNPVYFESLVIRSHDWSTYVTPFRWPFTFSRRL